MNAWGLVVAFDTVEPEFVRGFEAGALFAVLRECDRSLDLCPGHSQLVHAANAEMLLRLAEVTSHAVRVEEKADDWLEAVFSPVGRPENLLP